MALCISTAVARGCLSLPADGTVPFLSGERIAFSYLTSQKFTGDIATLDILREGKPMQLQIQVGSRQRAHTTGPARCSLPQPVLSSLLPMRSRMGTGPRLAGLPLAGTPAWL